jgi:long-chain acyl-CoA synthetase
VNLATIINDHDDDRLALIEGDLRLTYGELRRRVDSMRARLATAGIGIDDPLAVLAGNTADFAVTALAGLGLGARIVPVRPGSPLPELERKLVSVRPRLLVLGEAGSWIVERDLDLGVPLLDLATDAETSAEDAPPVVDRDADDIAFLMLTSGVASDAKVAMLSHGNLAWAQQAIMNRGDLGLQPDDVSLGVLPFSHIFGLNLVLLATLRVGGSVVLQHRFDEVESLELVKKYGITTLAGAPPMWQRWARADAPDDSMESIRHTSSGAAALPLAVFEAIRDRFGIEVAEGYGLTESSSLVTWSRGIAVRPTSVGKPIEGCEVVLVEPDGTPVDPGDTGEVVVRSPGVFKGYLDSPELTEAVLTDDGWFWTGDVGVFDEDGYLYLVDRIKDLIIVSGFNVYPSEVEGVLMQHPAVRGAVVVGEADVDTGETVVAHVLGSVDEDELHEWACANLSRYKCPTSYRFVDELPVAPTGKLIRRELRS